jgi:hypothetical protein
MAACKETESPATEATNVPWGEEGIEDAERLVSVRKEFRTAIKLLLHFPPLNDDIWGYIQQQYATILTSPREKRNEPTLKELRDAYIDLLRAHGNTMQEARWAWIVGWLSSDEADEVYGYGVDNGWQSEELGENRLITLKEI